MVISVFDTVESIVRKGEIACISNFSFSPHCFQKAFLHRPVIRFLVWEWVKADLNTVPFNPDFLRPWERSLLETLLERRK